MTASTIRLRRWLAGLALLLALPATSAVAQDFELPPVDEVFVLSAQATAPDRIEVRWRIADGYYLYRHRTSVKADAAFTGATMALPKGKAYRDEFFGDVETYRKELLGTLTGTPAAGASATTLTVKYQGCADAGVCYPPQTRTLKVALPGEAGAGGFGCKARGLHDYVVKNGSRRVHQCHHGIEIIQPQATAERARSWVEVRIGEEFELQTAALQDHPAAILPTRRKAQLRIKRLCHIEIARWQIGGDVVSHGSAQLVGHAGRMSDCGAAIGGGMAHHDHAGLGERRTKRAR